MFGGRELLAELERKKKERTGATSILRLGLEEWESLPYETV